MGAWGVGSFENDEASDWVCDLEDVQDWGDVRAALQEVMDGSGDDEPSVCCVALAAGEVVAAAIGRPIPDLPDEAAAWVKEHQACPDDLAALAGQAVSRVGTRSYLLELWEESDSLEPWRATIRDLESRLRAN